VVDIDGLDGAGPASYRQRARGMVLIDKSFEQKTSSSASRRFYEASAKWTNRAAICLWYPVKSRRANEALAAMSHGRRSRAVAGKCLRWNSASRRNKPATALASPACGWFNPPYTLAGNEGDPSRA